MREIAENRNNAGQQSIELEQRIYACWLDTIHWLTREAKYRLLETAGNVRDIYEMSEERIASAIGLQNCRRFLQHRRQCDPQRIWSSLAGLGISYTCCLSNDYPSGLANIPDPPFGLFYKGKLPDEKAPAVAVIGARKCSEYGRCMAERFSEALALQGVTIISGMAMGIDGISQSAALKAGGSSYAVLGCGADIIYPKSNEALYRQLVEKGGILSEYPPGMEPRPALFPPRNRIISALSDVVLVVEAREKSGTLITVDTALEQGKEVYVVPGRCTDTLSTGCNRLLRQGAAAAVAPEDIIEDMHWQVKKPQDRKTDRQELSLSKTAQELYSLMDIMPASREEIIRRLRENGKAYTLPQICQGFVELELKGVSVCQNGQYCLSAKAALDRQ
ncbi:MAG: DNA-processing protein DprA [Lachnospiraceae bacterium]|nr:DNA-processing protein DprA [Lachnospiraceae bacterium]